jgi:hypothetical protein
MDNDRNLNHAAQARELTDAELDCVSGGAFEIKDWSFGVTAPSTIGSR